MDNPQELPLHPGEISLPKTNETSGNVEAAPTIETGSPLENFPDREILDLIDKINAGNAKNWDENNEIKSFKKGEISLNGLSNKTIEKLLGLASDGEISYTGLRINKKLLPDGQTIDSTPSLLAKDFEDHLKEPFRSIGGTVQVVLRDANNREKKHLFIIQIDVIPLDSTPEKGVLDSNKEAFNLTIIPDENSIEFSHQFYGLVAENLESK